MLIHRLLICVLAVTTALRAAPAFAQESDEPAEAAAHAAEPEAAAAPADEPATGEPAHEAGEAVPAADDSAPEPAHDPTPEPAEAAHEAENGAENDAQGDARNDEADDAPIGSIDEDGEVVTDPFDADGDGVVTAEEAADKAALTAMFADIPDAPDAAALAARPEDKELMPSMTVEQFRAAVHLVERIVLRKMEGKIARGTAKKMRTFSLIVFGVSALGLLLLLMPFVLRRRYPGQAATLWKYSALAAATFIATVLLFGAVVTGLRTAQGALSSGTNPSIAVARGVFGTLDRNAEDYIVTGKELFAPTLDAMRAHPDEPPAAVLFENAQRLIKDAHVFLTVAKMVKRIDFVFALLPIILTFVTLVLFVLAIKPTLVEIIGLPAAAAAGTAGAGRAVLDRALHRIRGELFAGLGTVAGLAVLTVITGFSLSRAVAPALDALLGYLSIAVQYLQFVNGASSATVGGALFGVILFLVLNLAALIVSSALFLGKLQKVLQARFTHGVPLATHRKFFQWGVPAVVLVQLFPWLYVFLGQRALGFVNDKLLKGVTDAEAVPWGKLLLAGPAVLVVGFLVVAWAARVMKALKFLATYRVSAVAEVRGKQLGNADIELAADQGRDAVELGRR